jgi:hypothetical protein
MGNCVTNVPYSDGDFTSSDGGSYGQGVTETAYDYTVDFSGNWGYNANATSSNKYAKKYMANCKQMGQTLGIDWRLIAAVAMQESTMNPNSNKNKKDKDNNYLAAGLFGWFFKFWNKHAGDYKDNYENIFIPDAAFYTTTEAWKEHFTKFKNVSNLNDKIALVIQRHHDGSCPKKDGSDAWSSGDKWQDRGENSTVKGTKESREYLQKVIKHYKDFCK